MSEKFICVQNLQNDICISCGARLPHKKEYCEPCPIDNKDHCVSMFHDNTCNAFDSKECTCGYPDFKDTQDKQWLCKNCKRGFDKPIIEWGTCAGKKVDMIDRFCPNCGSGNVQFNGTAEECHAWWDKEWDN